MDSSPNVDCLFLTAVPDEKIALERALERIGARGREREQAPGVPTHFYWAVGRPDRSLTIVTASTLRMAIDAGEYTRKLIDHLHPTYVGFVGIAGAATDNTELGSILLADSIWCYELAKVKEESTDHRGYRHISSGEILDRLINIKLAVMEQRFSELAPWAPPFMGTIASGYKVIANRELRNRLRDSGHNVIGFDTEGHLFAPVVERMLGAERWFMVRSVQDHADEKKDDHFRQRACAKAAAYAVSLLIDSDFCQGSHPVGTPRPVNVFSPQEPIDEPGIPTDGSPIAGARPISENAGKEISEAASELLSLGIRTRYIHPSTLDKEFEGREADLIRLDAAARDKDLRVVYIYAIGGAGKTALVSKWLDDRRKEGELSFPPFKGGLSCRPFKASAFWSFGVEDDESVAAEKIAKELSDALNEPLPSQPNWAWILEMCEKYCVCITIDGIEQLQTADIGRDARILEATNFSNFVFRFMGQYTTACSF